MFGLKSAILLYLVSLAYSVCPTPESISPCICSAHSSSLPGLRCEGKDVKDLALLLNAKIKSTVEGTHIPYSYIYIINTTITSIVADTFGDAVFDNIIFQSNLQLTKIDVKAFRKSAEANSVHVFDLIDSPNYVNSEEIFNIVSNLRVKDKIGFKNIGIKEVPDNAFKADSSLRHLILDYNSIKRIGKSAFTPLSNLNQLVLYHNNISEIDSNGLSFDLSSKDEKHDLLVVLVSNQLTENSFGEDWSDSKGDRKVEFLLGSNKIDTIPETIFLSVLLSENTKSISFGGTLLKCDCRMKYLFDIRDKIESKLPGTECGTHSDHNLWSLKAEQLVC